MKTVLTIAAAAIAAGLAFASPASAQSVGGGGFSNPAIANLDSINPQLVTKAGFKGHHHFKGHGFHGKHFKGHRGFRSRGFRARSFRGNRGFRSRGFRGNRGFRSRGFRGRR